MLYKRDRFTWLEMITRARCKAFREPLIVAAVLLVIVAFDQRLYAQASDSSSPSPGATCANGASPGVLQLVPDTIQATNRLRLARKRFYLSSAPFNLITIVNLKSAPLLRQYYQNAGGSPQLINWLEQNYCDTIYCRELTPNEVKCDGTNSQKCVPEFLTAYRSALEDLKGDDELARKWITNYEPLSSLKLRIGFYESKMNWLKGAAESIARRLGSNDKLKWSITDKDGTAFFYDLCPGAYYISSIAPIEIDGVAIFWETDKPVKVEGPPDVNRAIVVTLALPPGKDKKNFFVGKLLTEAP